MNGWTIIRILIGLPPMQYDRWFDDVIISSHIYSSGVDIVYTWFTTVCLLRVWVCLVDLLARIMRIMIPIVLLQSINHLLLIADSYILVPPCWSSAYSHCLQGVCFLSLLCWFHSKILISGSAGPAADQTWEEQDEANSVWVRVHGKQSLASSHN
jgi:hypothetical protein